jgi:D-arabinose 1-dehydrogenase-like Zn-dependent alcohol dehydrogenase
MTYDFKVFKGSSNGDIHEAKTQRPEVTKDEVFVDITHSGVCGTDVHFHWVDMGLGHEGVGVVKAIGPEVKSLKM